MSGLQFPLSQIHHISRYLKVEPTPTKFHVGDFRFHRLALCE